jgi:hypothetical protein
MFLIDLAHSHGPSRAPVFPTCVTSTLKMEAVRSSDVLLRIYKSTPRIVEDNSLNIYCREIAVSQGK